MQATTKMKAAQKKWRDNNKEKIRTRVKAFYENNPEQRLIFYSKTRSKIDRIEFNLEVSDIVIPEYCPYLGIKLDTSYGDRKNPNRISLDRIDNSKGYIKGNVQVISYQANLMKSMASIPELITFAKGVLNIHDRETDN